MLRKVALALFSAEPFDIDRAELGLVPGDSLGLTLLESAPDAAACAEIEALEAEGDMRGPEYVRSYYRTGGHYVVVTLPMSDDEVTAVRFSCWIPGLPCGSRLVFDPVSYVDRARTGEPVPRCG